MSQVKLAWTDCRNNPYYSRFDAVNNKYQNNLEEINVRQIMIPLIQRNEHDQWVHCEDNDIEMDTDSEMIWILN